MLEKPWHAFYFIDILEGVAPKAAIKGIAGPVDQNVRIDLQKVHDAIKHNRAEHDKHKRLGDASKLQNLEDEFDVLIKDVRSLQRTRRGKPRESKKHASARKAFTQALHRAVKEISDEHPTAGPHFRHSVKVCMHPSYIPDSVVPWEF